MRKWQKEQLILMRDAVTDLMVFIGDQKIGRMPRAYFLLDNMRNNIEIFIITSGEQEQDFIQLMNVLFRDWWAANDEWDDESKKRAIIASRYLNSVGKGENALELAYVLKENLRNKEEDNYKEFIVPKYIEDAIKWVCE